MRFNYTKQTKQMKVKEFVMEDQKEIIIDTAKRSLKERGIQHFSLQKVAQESAIDLSDIHIYFKNENALLVSLLTMFIEQQCLYLQNYEVVGNRNVKQTINLWLLNLLEHRENDNCSNFFKQFWSLALYDKQVRLVLDQYYRELQKILAIKLVLITSGNCSAQKIESASCFLLPFIEGYSVTRPTLPISVLQLSDQLSESIYQILL